MRAGSILIEARSDNRHLSDLRQRFVVGSGQGAGVQEMFIAKERGVLWTGEKRKAIQM